MVFVFLTIAQMGHALGLRSHRESLFSMNLFANRMLLSAVVFTIIIQRKYLPENVLAIFKTKPTILPTWDPLAKSLDEMGR